MKHIKPLIVKPLPEAVNAGRLIEGKTEARLNDEVYTNFSIEAKSETEILLTDNKGCPFARYENGKFVGLWHHIDVQLINENEQN